MSDPFIRKIQMLKLIGSHKQKKGIKEIHAALLTEGFDVNIRSVQRDIKLFELLFDIENDGNKDQPGWVWKKDPDGVMLPSMSPITALTFKLAERYLQRVFPSATLNHLKSYFKDADAYLKTTKENKLNNWDDKVSIISPKQQFITPEVNSELQDEIYDGLLNNKQLNVIYQGKYRDSRDYVINPIGIVVVDDVIYLLGTLWKYTNVRQFALHRFIEVNVSEDEAISVEGFNQQEYIKQGNFGFPVSDKEKSIDLVFKAQEWVADFVDDQALSTDQTIEFLDDGSERPYKISGNVLNTAQLRWWLSHYVTNIEIIAPASLRDEFKNNAKRLHSLYCPDL